MTATQHQKEHRHWQLSPDSTAIADILDIARCLDIILATKKGSDVLRPTFGSAHLDYLDAPTDILIPNMVREVHLAVQTWEKRVVIKDIYFTGAAPHLTMIIDWQVADSVKGEIYKSDFVL